MSEHVNDCDCCQRKLAALRIAGTIDGIHLRQRDAYRDVLRDLIAELRTYNTTMGGRLPQSDPDLAALVDRAEAQLRELDTRPQLANERINLGGERR